MANDIAQIIEKTINSIPTSITEDEASLFNSFPVNQAIPVLQKLFRETSDTTIESRIFDAILKIKDFDKVQFLIDLFKESSIDWRIICCKHLAKFQDKRAINKLCEIVMTDDDPDVRYCATESLSIIGDTTAITVLEQVNLYDTGEDYEGFRVSDMARQAIEIIKNRI